MEKVLVTGSCGFIGMQLSKRLLEQGYQVLGLDNMNNYYSVKLKKNRLDLLHSFSNFSFFKTDISDYESLSSIFKKYSPDKVVNLAAQAGVRYSILILMHI